MESKRVGDQTVHIYQSVIDTVISKVKPDLISEGVDESVLDELRALWEAKLVQTGAVGDPNQAEAQQVLGTAQPPRPAALQYRQALPGMPGLLPGAGHAQFAAQFHAMGPGGITQLVQPHQRYVLPAGLAAAGVPGGYIPPGQPGAAAASAATAAAAALGAELDRKRKLEAMQAASGMSAATALQQQQQAAAGPPLKREQLAGPGPGPAGHIPQQDGPADDGDGEGGDTEAGEPDEELNENDDLAAVDDEEVDEEQLKDVVLGQFDKVSRTKARWKVQLKDCIITAHGRDYLVHKATGEMNF